MRVVYFGSGTFSVPSLQAVLATRHEVVGVFMSGGFTTEEFVDQ